MPWEQSLGNFGVGLSRMANITVSGIKFGLGEEDIFQFVYSIYIYTQYIRLHSYQYKVARSLSKELTMT